MPTSPAHPAHPAHPAQPTHTTVPRESALVAAQARTAMGIVDAPLVPAGARPPAPLQGLPGGPAVNPQQQSELMSQIVAGMRAMHLPEYAGTGGSLEGAVVRMPLRRLWLNPFYPVDYPDQEQLRALGASLKRRQVEPLIVTPALDPDGGVPYQVRDHVIISGKQRFLAAPYGGLSELSVQVVRYPSFYHLMLATVAGKVAQHPLSDLEFARLILALKQAHDLAREQQPDLPRFPTQEQLAAHLGVSQTTIARRLALVRLQPEVLGSLVSGKITVAQAKEMIHAPAPVQRAIAAQVIEENEQRAAAGEAPVPTSAVREHVRDVRRNHPRDRIGSTDGVLRPTPPVLLPSNVILPDGLWLDALYEMPASEAVAHLVHDLDAALEAVVSAMERPGGWVLAVQRALEHPDAKRFLRETYPEASE